MTVDSSSTLRTPVSLPPMPRESVAAETYPPIVMARARFEREKMVFDAQDGFDRALSDGFFLLRIGGEVDFSAGDLFARNFFRSKTNGALEDYTGFKECDVPGDYEGYFDRPHDQWENFYIERSHWDLIPPEVRELGDVMAQLGLSVLRAVLANLGIPSSEWARVSGGLTENAGHQMLAFNHFRADKAARGSKFHRDSGWVTVLRSTEPGLLAYINGELRSINPEPGCVIVNFGSSIEVLTERLSPPVRANVHGVVQTERGGRDNRVSYVIFLDSALDGDIYRYEDDGPIRVQSVAEFAVQEVERTYDDHDSNL